MPIKPSEQDLVFYHASPTGWDKQDQPLRADLVFYHPDPSGGLLTQRSTALTPGFHVILVVLPEVAGVVLAPSLLGLFLSGFSAGCSWAGLLPRPNTRIGTKELTAKPALLPQG